MGNSRGTQRTDGNGVVDILRFDDVAQEHGRLFLALYTLVVVKDDAGRVDDPQPALELHRLQLFRMSRLRRHSTGLYFPTPTARARACVSQ